MRKRELVSQETDEEKQARWAKQMKSMKTFAKQALTRAQRDSIAQQQKMNRRKADR